MIALDELPTQLLLLLLALVLLIPIFRRHGRRHRLPPSPVGMPIIGHFHLLGPLLHRSFHDLSLRLGPLFTLRLGSVPCVVASTPDLARELLKTNELSFTSRPNFIAVSRLTYDTAMVSSPYDAYWKFLRRITTNDLLGSRPISGFSRLRSRELSRFLRVLADKSSRHEAANLSAELRKMSYAVILHMMLGGDSAAASHGMDEGRVEEARTVVRDVTRIFGEFNLSDFVWFLKRIDLQGFGKRIEDIFRRYDTLIETVIREREELRRNRKDGVGSIDFLDILLDCTEDPKDDNVQFTRLHIKGLIMDIFTAGTDTTATSIEWTLSELINNPTVLEKAREEIDRVVGETRLVSESDIPNLPYLQAVVKEAFRLHPPAPLVTRKCVKECKVGEYTIPVDTMLIVNTWTIGRDPNHWESPLDFQPNRFLEAHSGVDVKGQHFELLPFGSGRRMCPGYNSALQILPLAVAAIIQCFDLKVVGSIGDSKDGNGDGGGDGPVLNMEEGVGLTIPRLHELVCVPVARHSTLTAILESELENNSK